MGTISSGVGLISGIDIEGLVGQLLAIEARPREQLASRIDGLTKTQTALLAIQARVLSIRLAAINFNQGAIFQQKAANSSNEDILGISATRFALPGNYSFQVKRLASSHQLASNLFSSRTSSVGAGTMSFEIGQGQLSRPTDLSFINGQHGFDRGGLTITDRAGATAKLDLTAALTMQDVVDKINSNSDVAVTAAVSGDHLVILDQSGSTSGNLIITGSSAVSLGIETGAVGATGDTLIGSDLLSITADTKLSSLNDGNSVDLLEDMVFTKGTGPGASTLFSVDFRDTLFEVVGSDPSQATRLSALNGGGGVRLGTIRITDRNEKSVEVDLGVLDDDANLVDLKSLIEQEAINAGMVDNDGNSTIVVQFNGRDHLQVRDSSQPLGSSVDERHSRFIIEDVDGGLAAADLGIVDDLEGSTVLGHQVYRMDTVGDVINVINNHYENDGSVFVEINEAGTGLKVTDSSGLSGELVISGLSADDLGIMSQGTIGNVEGRRLIAGLNTVMLRSLNGGAGGDSGSRITEGGMITLADRDGQEFIVDLTDAFTVQDVIDRINSAGTHITTAVNQAGNGITLTDSSTGTAHMSVSGDLADKLGIAVDGAVNRMESGNLQLQYISQASRLDDLRQSQGIRLGEIEITDAAGARVIVNLKGAETVGEAIDRINHSALEVEARINATGDGIAIIDHSTGEGTLTIEEVNGGKTAHDLRILGTAQASSNVIDESYEFKLEVGGGDDMDDIVSRINQADIGIQAAVIGNDENGFRISYNSEISGSAGVIHLDAGSTQISATTIAEGQDALLLNNSLLIRSSSNSVENVIKGTTLELKSVDDEVVHVTVEQDVEGIVSQIQNFVDAYNGLMDDIDEVTRFDSETLDRGILFGDSAINTIKRALQSMVQRSVPSQPVGLKQLLQIGVSFSRSVSESGTDVEGNPTQFAIARTPRLQFDESVFRDALEKNPEAVAELFTKTDEGIGDFFATQLDSLAGQSSGTIKSRVDAINDRQELFQRRIDRLDDLLARKEERLFRQFFAMEQALASLQSQQGALASLSSLAASFSSRNR